MELHYIPEPTENGIVIYIEKSCLGCRKIIQFLKENNIEHSIVDCSKFFQLGQVLNPLITFIDKNVRKYQDYAVKYKDVIIFPMIFKNGKFIGYCKTTEDYINNLQL